MGTPLKASPQVVVLDKALNLAEQWVNNMSGSTAHELAETEMENRPARLGLGANYTPHSKEAASAYPIKRKLQAKIDGMKKRAAKKFEEESTEINGDVEEEDDNDSDSRAHTFTKKRLQKRNTK